jgi:hypothetical protein
MCFGLWLGSFTNVFVFPMQKWDIHKYVRDIGLGHLPCVEVEEVCVFLCARQLKCYLTLLRHVQAATVDHQVALRGILTQWRPGDVLVCFSPDR